MGGLERETRRTHHGVAAATFLWFAGNYFVLPFLPLYVQQLGGHDAARAAVWSGVILAVTPLMSAAFAPLWGTLSDRFGKKAMLQRSLLGFAVCLGLMGVAQAPWQLLAIRVFMGIFGGFTSVSVAVVARGESQARITTAIGRVNAARVVGMGVGPLVGGIMADLVGFRLACAASMASAAAAFALTTVLVRESRAPRRDKAQRSRPPVRSLVTWSFVTVFLTALVVRFTERTFDPVLPLLLSGFAQQTVPVASATAIVASAGLLATAVSSTVTGRLTRHLPAGTLLWVACLGAGLVFVPMFVTTAWWQPLLLRVAIGLCLGTALTLAYARVARDVPEDRRGLAYGLTGSGSSYGAAAGSLTAGLLAPLSLPSIFLVDALLMVIAAALVLTVSRTSSKGDAAQ